MQKENVIFIMCDHWRADTLGCAGNQVVLTPNLDKLAAEGANFTNAYTSSPVCVPARQGLLTERLPNSSKSHHNGQHIQLNCECPSFVRQLQNIGVETANWGKLHFTWRSDFELPFSKHILHDVGFNDAHEIRGKSLNYERIHYSEYMEHLDKKGLLKKYLKDLFKRRDESFAAGGVCTVHKGHGPSVLSPDDHLDGWIINQANNWIANNTKNPFFLWIGPPGPHDPYDPPTKYDNLYNIENIPKPIIDDPDFPPAEQNVTSNFKNCTNDDIMQSRLNFYRSLTFIDEYLGKLFNTLEEKGMLSNTWIIFTSDHADHLGDHGMMLKSTFHDSSARIPLIIRPPDKYKDISRGITVDSLTSLIDISATITDVMSAEKTPGGMGSSLKDTVLNGGYTDKPRDVVYSDTWSFNNKKYSDADAVKLLMVRTEKWKMVINQETGVVIRLTDMVNDPEERRNLKKEKEFISVIEELKKNYVEPYIAEGETEIAQSWHPYSAPPPSGIRRIPPLEMWAKN